MALDYKEHLRRQLSFIGVSAREYDAGNRDEAIRIGTSLRILFHDTSSSTSLLTHLAANGIKLLGTGGEPTVKNPPFWFGLTDITVDVDKVRMDMVPKLAQAKDCQMVPLSSWWEQQLVYVRGNTTVTRRHAVLHAANKDGGAHVDPTLPKIYRDLLDGLGWSFAHQRGGQTLRSAPLRYCHLAPLRQMAYEVLNSPELLALC